MHDIDYSQPTAEFIECWNSAARHFSNLKKDIPIRWINADLGQPSMEHCSFGIGNQLFHIRIHDADGVVIGPGNTMGLKSLSQETGGHACVLWMERKNGAWIPVHDGWGLTFLESEELVVPEELVTDEEIEISDWELYDLALTYVKKQLEENEIEVTSWLRWDASLCPSIWFQKNGEVEWAIVRAVRYPQHEAKVPDDYNTCQEHMSKQGFPTGNVISVAIADSEDPFDFDALENGNYLKLYRGRGFFMKVTYPVLQNRKQSN